MVSNENISPESLSPVVFQILLAFADADLLE